MELSLHVLWFIGEVLLLGTFLGIARLAVPAETFRDARREILLVLVLGALAVWATPRFVAEFRISPDSVEYVAGARSLVDSGRFELPLGEPALAPRYPPWFSALWIAPVFLSGLDIGWSIMPITVAALIALLCAFRVGTCLGGLWGGVGSALAVLVVPGFVFFSRQVLIDIPTTTLVLGGGLVFLRLRSIQRPHWSLVLLGGLIVGNAVLLRPTGLVIALPLGLALLLPALRRVGPWALFTAPILAAVGAGAMYNYQTFGDVARSGYNLWCGIPYDFITLTFGVRYVVENGHELFLDSGLAVLLVFLLGCLGAFRRFGLSAPRDLRLIGIYTGAVAVPLTIFHLIYFFPAVRFIVPVSTLVATILGALVGSSIGARAVRGVDRARLLLVLIVVVGGYRLSVSELPAGKGDAARTIRAFTGERSLIVSGIDPVYLGLMVGSTREYLPISRRVEYASKFLAEKKLTIDPAVVEPRCANPDQRLLRFGARQAIPRVALDDPDYVTESVTSGRPVFLDATRITSEERLRFEERFSLTERAPNLFEVGLNTGVQ